MRQAVSEQKLRECPLCGGEAEIVKNYYQGTGASGMSIRCKSCRLETRQYRADDWPFGRAAGLPTYKQVEAEAIAAWNTRAPTASTEDEVERELIEALEGDALFFDSIANDEQWQATGIGNLCRGYALRRHELIAKARNSHSSSVTGASMGASMASTIAILEAVADDPDSFTPNALIGVCGMALAALRCPAVSATPDALEAENARLREALQYLREFHASGGHVGDPDIALRKADSALQQGDKQ